MTFARRAVCVSLLLMILMAAPAQAALFLVFETKSYTPSGYEIARTGGVGAPGEVTFAPAPAGKGAMSGIDAMPVFVTNGAAPSSVESIEDLQGVEGMTRVGDLRPDGQQTGHLEFKTPDLPPGDYQLVAYCPTCAPYSAGANVVALAPFRIVAGAERASSGANRTPVFVGAIALVLFVRVGMDLET